MIFLKGVVSYVLKDDPEGQILYVNALGQFCFSFVFAHLSQRELGPGFADKVDCRRPPAAVIHKHLGVGEERIDSIEIAADLDPVRVRAGEVMALLESKAMAV